MSTIVSPSYSHADFNAAGPTVSSVAIIGPGRVGTAVARTLVAAGVDVSVVGTGNQEMLEMMADVVMPGVRVLDLQAAAATADVVVLAVPLHKIATVDASALAGSVVVDVTNYWEPIDGHLPAFADAPHGTSAVVASLFPAARIVKSLNHVGYHEIDGDALPAGHPQRRAVAVMGDDARARALVASMVD